MKTHLKILSLFIVLTSVLMKSEDVFVGTVGEKVEIRCPHSDDYKYTPKYFCKHPCKSSGHVLIESKGNKEYTRNGRYTLTDMNGKFFTVTISDLSLKDAGYYYCGLNQWFQDTLTKVRLSVHPVLFSAAPVDRPSQPPENTIITTTTFTWTTTTAGVTSNNSTSYEQFSPTVQPKEFFFFSLPVVCAAVLVLLVFGVLVALVFLCRKISHSKSRCLNHAVPENSAQDSLDPNQTVDDVFHIYDEMVTTYSLAGPARNADSSVIYSTVQRCDPAPLDDVNDFYSLTTEVK